jgi:hypothetical protein
MKEIIDLLKINGLENDSEIEYKIFHNWSIGQIKIFVEQFNEIIDNAKPPLHTSPFSFMPNSNMTAQHFFCPEWDCRLNRVDKLSRFAVFYSDLIMFPNYFSYYDHLSGRLTQHEELTLRYNFIGDIKIINKIKPLLNAGLIKFTQSNGHIERFNRTSQEQFVDWYTDSLDDPDVFNRSLMNYLIWYNTEKPHRAIGKMPPLRYYLEKFATPEKSNMLWPLTVICTHTNFYGKIS